jgi:hypothetical protein
MTFLAAAGSRRASPSAGGRTLNACHAAAGFSSPELLQDFELGHERGLLATQVAWDRHAKDAGIAERVDDLIGHVSQDLTLKRDPPGATRRDP